MAPFPWWISVPSSFVSLFIFYNLSYLLLKTMGRFSGHLMSSASDQKLFCAVCSEFKYSFNEFVRGESGLPILFLHHLWIDLSEIYFLTVLAVSPRSRCWQGWFLVRPFLFCRDPRSLCPHLAFPLWTKRKVSRVSSSFYKDTSPMGLGSHSSDLILSLIISLKAPSLNIITSLVGLQHMNFEEIQFSQ